jgi:cytoskeletal protein RodZ
MTDNRERAPSDPHGRLPTATTVAVALLVCLVGALGWSWQRYNGLDEKTRKLAASRPDPYTGTSLPTTRHGPGTKKPTKTTATKTTATTQEETTTTREEPTTTQEETTTTREEPTTTQEETTTTREETTTTKEPPTT